MPVAIEHTPDAIRLTLWGAESQRMAAWEDELDRMVFEEQLATGSFRGRFEVHESILRGMRMAQEAGGIMPYYGAGGSRGAGVYTFRPAPPTCGVAITNSLVQETLDQQAEILPAPGADEPAYRFRIEGAELANLRTWECWAEDQAASGRYSFRFGTVSLGPLGYTVGVIDHQSGTELNATNYDDW